MVTFNVIQKPASVDNPLGKEVVEALQNQLRNLKYNEDSLQQLVRGRHCPNDSHINFKNEVEINEITGNITINACCNEYTAILRQALS